METLVSQAMSQPDRFGWLGSLISAGITLAAWMWVIYKTGSSDVLTAFVWRILARAQWPADSRIGMFLQERTFLMGFRFRTGVPVRSYAQMERLVQWCKEHDVEVGEVGACGPFFDLEAVDVKSARCLPSKSELEWARIGLVLIGFVVAFVVVLASLPDAILTMKDSGATFAMTTTAARRITGPGVERPARLTAGECSGDRAAVAVRTGFTPKDVTIICNSFAAKDTSQFLREAVELQRWVFSGFAVLLGALFIFVWRWRGQGRVALAMKERIGHRLNWRANPQCTLVSGTVSALRIRPACVHPRDGVEVYAVQTLAGAFDHGGGRDGARTPLVPCGDGEAVEAFEMSIGSERIIGYLSQVGFKSGDDVEVVGRRHPGYFEALAVALPRERLIWVRPHCEQGSSAMTKAEWLRLRPVFCVLGLACVSLWLVIAASAKWQHMLVMTVVIALEFFAFGVYARLLLGNPGVLVRFGPHADAIGKALRLSDPDELDLPANAAAARQRGWLLPRGAFCY